MTHVKHLRVETGEELGVLQLALATLAEGGPADGAAVIAMRLMDRLEATPAARHGGVVHVEDATYASSTGDGS